MSARGLVIFDNDGVLVDSEEISNTVLAASLTDAGLPTTLEDSYREYMGMQLHEIEAKGSALLGRPLPAGFLERYESDRAEVFERDLRPVEGARAAVEAARGAGHAVCVASQGGPNKIRSTLELCGLLDLFEDDALFSSRMVERGKPHPDLFLHAAATAGFDPRECTVVEDSPSGTAAGVAAGMRVLGMAARGNEPALRDAGAETFPDMAAIAAEICGE